MNIMVRVFQTIGRALWQVIYHTLNAVYKTITRTALYGLTLALCVYFLVNSSLGRQAILDGINSAIPGTCSADTIQWGPQPWKVSLLNVDIRDPRGVSIIEAQQVHADFDFEPLGDYLTRAIVGREAPVPIIFERATVHKADVLVRSDDGWLGISEAFTDGKPSPESGPGAHVIIKQIAVHDTATELGFRGFAGRLTGVNILADLKVIGGKLDIQGKRVDVERGDLWFPSVVVDSKALHLPIADFLATDTQVTKTLVGIGHAETIASTMALKLQGQVNTGLPTVTLNATANLDVALSDPVIFSLSRLPLAGDGSLIVQAQGPVDALQIDANLESDDLWVDGLGLGPTDLSVSLGPAEALSTDGMILNTTPMVLDTMDGMLFVDRFMLAMGSAPGPELHMETALRLFDINPSLAWTMDSLRRAKEPPAFLDGTLQGEVLATANKTPIDAAFSSWTIHNQLLLQHDWQGKEDSILQPEVALQGESTVVFGADETSVQTDGVRLYSGYDFIDIHGHVDLGAETLELGMNGRLQLKHLNGLFPDKYRSLLNGKATLDNVQISGTMMDPSIKARIQAERLRLQTKTALDVGRVTATVHLADGTLNTKNLRMSGPWGRVRTALSLGLWHEDISNINDRLPLKIRNLHGEDLGLGQWTGDQVSGSIAVRSKAFQMSLGASGLEPKGTVSVSSSNLKVGGERLKHVSTQLKVAKKTLIVDNLKAIAHSGSRLVADGSWNWDTSRTNLKLAANQVNLAQLQAIKGAKLPARGTVDLSFQGKGPLNRLAFDGSLNVTNFGWGDIELGAAQLDFHRKRGESLVHLNSKRFFPSLSLQLGRLELDRSGQPVRLTVAANSKKSDLLQILPGLKDSLQSALLAEGAIHYDLFFRGTTNTVLTVDIPKKGLVVTLPNNAGTLTNETPLWTRQNGDIIVVDPTIFGWNDHRLAICGFVGPSDRIQLDMAGSLDLGSLPQMTKVLADAKGQLITHAVHPDEDSFEESCLLELADDSTLASIGNPTGVVFLRDRLSSPSIDGAFRANKLWVATRGRRQELALNSGVILLDTLGDVEKTPRIRVQNTAPLLGTYDDREFVLTGHAQLQTLSKRTTAEHWLPDTGQFHMEGKQDFEWVSPDGYELAFIPDLTLQFDGIHSKSATKRSLSLEGDVNVTQGTIFKSFNRFAQAFSNMLGRTVEVDSGSLAEDFPLLNEMTLGLKIHGNNMRIKSEFGLGGIDVDSRFDLKVTETLSQPEISGWLEVTEGIITYNVVKREFSITDGKLEFSGDPLEPEIDVTAETTIERSISSESSNLGYSGDDENIVVTIKLTGTPSNMNDIKLESRPSYSPGDLQWLILTGRTKSEFEDRSFQGDPAAVNLLGADVAGWMTGVLRAPFIKSVEIAPLVGGGGQVEVITRLGKAIRLDTTVRQEHGDTSYHAGFRFKINDRLSLEGRLRGAGEDTDGRQTYETKVKYSIPLD